MEYPISSDGTPYPSLEYPISPSGITLFPQWNASYPALEYQVFRHRIEIMTDTSTPPPPVPKSHSDFTKIILRFYQNHTPILPKSLADSHQITPRLYQNHTPTLPIMSTLAGILGQSEPSKKKTTLLESTFQNLIRDGKISSPQKIGSGGFENCAMKENHHICPGL